MSGKRQELGIESQRLCVSAEQVLLLSWLRVRLESGDVDDLRQPVDHLGLHVALRCPVLGYQTAVRNHPLRSLMRQTKELVGDPYPYWVAQIDSVCEMLGSWHSLALLTVVAAVGFVGEIERRSHEATCLS